MLNLGRVLIVAALLIASSMSAFAQDKSETFLVTGMGSTHELAVQNAASNALTAAVGKFVDVKTQIEKRTEIKDGVALITKDLTENFIASSNGTIEKIDVVSSSSAAGLYTVEAMINVRMDDLRTAMEGQVDFLTPMNQGLFSAVKANEDNSSQKVQALVEGIFKPSQDTSTISVEVGKPFNLKDTFSDNSLLGAQIQRPGLLSGIMYSKQSAYQASEALNPIIAELNASGKSVIVVPLTVSLTDSAFKNLSDTTQSLAASKMDFALTDRTPLYFDDTNNYYFNSVADLSSDATQNLNRYLYDRDAVQPKICFVGDEVLTCYELDGLPVAVDIENHPFLSIEDPFNPGRTAPYRFLATLDQIYELRVSLLDSNSEIITFFDVHKGASTAGLSGAYSSDLSMVKAVSAATGVLEADPSLFSSFFPLLASPNDLQYGWMGRDNYSTFLVVKKKVINIAFPLTVEELEKVVDIKVEVLPPASPYR